MAVLGGNLPPSFGVAIISSQPGAPGPAESAGRVARRNGPVARSTQAFSTQTIQLVLEL